MRRLIGNILSLTLAIIVAALTVWASKRYLKTPQNSLDYCVLAFSALTTAIIAFFVTWGHFQKDPAPDQNP